MGEERKWEWGERREREGCVVGQSWRRRERGEEFELEYPPILFGSPRAFSGLEALGTKWIL